MKKFLSILFLVFIMTVQDSNADQITPVLKEDQVHVGVWPAEEFFRSQLPSHHAYHVEWKNKDAYPNLSEGTKLRFKIISKKISQISKDRWNDEYVCEILKVEKP